MSAVNSDNWQNAARLLSVGVTSAKAIAPFSQVKSVTASQNIGFDANTYLVDATGGAVTLTLPALANAVRAIAVKKIDASGNAVTVDGYGSETIEGTATKSTTTQWASWVFVPGASEWYLF